MARDPLQVLLSMRQRAVEQARHALAERLKVEAEIAQRLCALDAAVQRDRATSEAWQDAHQFLEVAAAQLHATRIKRRTMAEEAAAAMARSAEARSVVAAARTAAEVVDQLISERAAAGQADTLRREQHVLDDITRARHPMRPPDADQ